MLSEQSKNRLILVPFSFDTDSYNCSNSWHNLLFAQHLNVSLLLLDLRTSNSSLVTTSTIWSPDMSHNKSPTSSIENGSGINCGNIGGSGSAGGDRYAVLRDADSSVEYQRRLAEYQVQVQANSMANMTTTDGSSVGVNFSPSSMTTNGTTGDEDRKPITLSTGMATVSSLTNRPLRPHSTPATLLWLEENYEIADGVCIPRSTLYMHYVDFCARNSIQPVNAASFGKVRVVGKWARFLTYDLSSIHCVHVSDHPATISSTYDTSIGNTRPIAISLLWNRCSRVIHLLSTCVLAQVSHKVWTYFLSLLYSLPVCMCLCVLCHRIDGIGTHTHHNLRTGNSSSPPITDHDEVIWYLALVIVWIRYWRRNIVVFAVFVYWIHLVSCSEFFQYYTCDQ